MSAPIRNTDGSATMTVMAAVFTTLDDTAIRNLGEQLRSTAQSIGQRIARHGDMTSQ